MVAARCACVEEVGRARADRTKMVEATDRITSSGRAKSEVPSRIWEQGLPSATTREPYRSTVPPLSGTQRVKIAPRVDIHRHRFVDVDIRHAIRRQIDQPSRADVSLEHRNLRE